MQSRVAEFYSMSNKEIHKLALVSRILLDREVLHLRQENERLRLQLFWKDHSIRHLQELMREANQAEEGPRCDCWSCAVTGRIEEGQEPVEAACKFKGFFEALMAQCSLTAVTGVEAGQDSVGTHMSMDDGNSVYDNVDAHFHHLIRDDWWVWTYGARLWKCQSADDPELAKLKALFVLLDRFIHGDDE